MKLHFRKVGVGPPVLVLRLLASLGQSAGGILRQVGPGQKPVENPRRKTKKVLVELPHR
jgi:hypothetical protein